MNHNLSCFILIKLIIRKVIGIVFLLIISCNDQNTELKTSFNIAKENKKEIQKILDYYSLEKDSLKLRASLFLLRNMRDYNHIAISPQKEWNNILAVSSSLVDDNVADKVYKQKVDSLYNSCLFSFEKIPDLQAISAKEFITNVELAFSVWPMSWNDQLNFNEFCNLILPYKSKSEPFNIKFRKSYYNKNVNKVTNDSILALAEEIGTFSSEYKYHRIAPYEQGISDIKKGKMADCLDYANFASSKARAIGLPLVVDYAIWPNGRGFHYWNALLYNKDSMLYADKDFFWGSPKNYELRRKISKIYRHSFSRTNVEKVNLDTIPKAAHHLFDNHKIDVTNQYLKTVSGKVPLVYSNKNLVNKLAYLCIFNNLQWTPIAYARIKEKNKVIFKNLAANNVHTVFISVNKKLIPASHAFTINDHGKVVNFEPKLGFTRSVNLSRKTKVTKRIKEFGANLIGTKIELSNSRDFKNSRLVFEISDTIVKPYFRAFNNRNKYRYARLLNNTEETLELARFIFYSKGNELDATVWLPDIEVSIDTPAIADSDPLSYISVPSKNNVSSIGFDFGQKTDINGFDLLPRTDFNYVISGDTYELLYWNIGWVTHGLKKATDYQISFKDVPKNCVLWLRNLSRGHEEDLFIYKDDEQLFWNSTEYN